MPRQLKLKPETLTVKTSLIVSRSQIPADLTEAEKRVLRDNLDIDCGVSFFFWDSPEVRRVLRMRGGQ